MLTNTDQATLCGCNMVNIHNQLEVDPSRCITRLGQAKLSNDC